MRPRYCSFCRRYHAPSEPCWQLFTLLYVAALFAACSMATAAPGDVEEFVDNDCDGDADGDADGALTAPWSVADNAFDAVDADGDGDGDADGEAMLVPIAWRARMLVGDESIELEAVDSWASIWPDGPIAFELNCDDAKIVLVLSDDDAGEHCSYPGCAGVFEASIDSELCLASPGGSQAFGYLRVPGLQFAVQFVGEDGCSIQIADGEIDAPWPLI